MSNQNTPYFTAYFRFLNTTELFGIFSFSFLGLAMFFVSFWRFSLSWLSFTWTKQRIFLFAISEDCNRRKMHFLFHEIFLLWFFFRNYQNIGFLNPRKKLLILGDQSRSLEKDLSGQAPPAWESEQDLV